MKFKSCHDKHTFLIFIGNIYDPNIPARCSLPDQHLGSLPSHIVYTRLLSCQLKPGKAERQRKLEDLIRRRLAMPIEQRMNFLRKRLPGGGSCL